MYNERNDFINNEDSEMSESKTTSSVETKTLDETSIEIEHNNVFPNMSAGTTQLVALKEQKINDLANSVDGQYATIADRLLDNQKIADAGVLGGHLNHLIATAKEFDPSKFKSKSWIGKIVNFVSGAKDQLLANSDSVNDRIERVLKEIDKQIALHESRQADIQELKAYNESYHNHLTKNIEKGKAMIEELEAAKAEADAKSYDSDSFAASESHALKNQIMRVHALVQEFENSRMRSKQVDVELETMQQSGRNLIQTVKVAKQSLIPNWKMALIQFIMSREQAKTAGYSKSLIEANEQSMRALGNQIGENATQAATLVNTQSVSMELLAELNDKIIKTGQEVDKIIDKAKTDRETNAVKRKQLEKDLITNARGK